VFFDLADSSGADSEPFTDVEEAFGGVVEAEAGSDDLSFSFRKVGEEGAKLLAGDGPAPAFHERPASTAQAR